MQPQNTPKSENAQVLTDAPAPVQSSARIAGPNKKTGMPATAGNQRAYLLQLLREAGRDGISRETLLNAVAVGGYGLTQAGTRIHELEAQGYIFEHRKPRDTQERFVRYVLLSEPIEPAPAPAPTPRPAERKRKPGWQSQGFSFGSKYSPGRKPPTPVQPDLFMSGPRPAWADPDLQRKGER